MRKIIVSEFLSVDGMMSDPGDTMKWVTDNFSDKGGDYQSNLYGSIDTLLFAAQPTTSGVATGQRCFRIQQLRSENLIWPKK